jgi:transcriptional regulator with XRE-family HTH domain
LNNSDPRAMLARRLRALREEHWPGRKLTQPQLARALGVSVPLISSWESLAQLRVPPLQRIDTYALLFATTRFFDADSPGPPDATKLNDDERRAMNELVAELRGMRIDALRAGATVAGDDGPAAAPIKSGPWRFDDRDDVAIVCGQLPPEMLEMTPYTNVDEPDYIELLNYSDLDALLELYGHLRAANPESYVRRRIAGNLSDDDRQSHMAILGGQDWNTLTRTMMETLGLPIRQVADWATEGAQYFETDDGAAVTRHMPVLRMAGDKSFLHEDVALFARAVNPFNREKTVTICCGMYGRGTYGAIRALTDYHCRERNSRHITSRFGDSKTYCILTRVPIVHGATVTPDWATGDHTLFEWSR